jgi:uncharacterized hydrophobic protein (TIGR00271 family)
MGADMRQLTVKVTPGKGQQILEIAKEFEGRNLACLDASDESGEQELVIINVNNSQVGPLLEQLDSYPDAQITLFPNNVHPMSPPLAEVRQQVRDVAALSPIEVWLSGIQSVGSWKGFLGYTISGAILVWLGMQTGTVFLLVAAMILSPFPEPAINLSLGTARGDKHLFASSIFRYFISLILTILVTAALSFIVGQQIASPMMAEIAEISSVIILLPIVAGAAGALNIVQSENSSLVSGTAVGLLVAASLAPPAGLIGMALPIGRWDMIENGLFMLLLQLVAIHISGTLVFRAYGNKPRGGRFDRGTIKLFYISLGVSTVALIALLSWQFLTYPNLQRGSISQEAIGEVEAAVMDGGVAELIEADLRFAGQTQAGSERLLGQIFVQPVPGLDIPESEVRSRLERDIRQRLVEQGILVPVLLDITLLSDNQP